jgi:hypothetical protein
MNLNTYYDLKYGPCTFDFATYLVLANAVRQSIKHESMSVTIVCDRFRKKTYRDHKLLETHKDWRVKHILSRLPFLIPQVSNLDMVKKPLEEIKFPAFPGGYPPHPQDTTWTMPIGIIDLEPFYNNKEINLRPFRSSEGAKDLINTVFNDNVITITLRTSKFEPLRNSNLSEWYKVYLELKKMKFRPIVIPDFDDYMGDQDFAKYDWEIYAPAVMDIDLRLALYEKSADNLCIQNGTSTLLMFSDCRYHMFKILTEEVSATSASHLKRTIGIDIGEPLAFSTTDQQWIWENDDADKILKFVNI